MVSNNQQYWEQLAKSIPPLGKPDGVLLSVHKGSVVIRDVHYVKESKSFFEVETAHSFSYVDARLLPRTQHPVMTTTLANGMSLVLQRRKI